LFVNYCMSCHSLSYMRYNRMGSDMGLTDAQVKDNLMFASDKVVDSMDVAMQKGDAKKWFGSAPPDLSVIARSRGANWLYSYLLTFYADASPTRPFGVNNVVFKDVAMPHALWALQGHQRYVAAPVEGTIKLDHVSGLATDPKGVLIRRQVTLDSGEVLHVSDRLEVDIPGQLTPGAYREASRDLVNFLVYVGEPSKLQRDAMGFWVLLFLAILFVLSRMLYKEYWRDVH
jgi:ubiquinol-cytochrome c reductase cytochrome c1 subunit